MTESFCVLSDKAAGCHDNNPLPSICPPSLSVTLSSHSHMSLLTLFRKLLNFSLSVFRSLYM